MPFKSEKQRAWMFKNEPDMAQEWADKYGYKIKEKKKKDGNKKSS